MLGFVNGYAGKGVSGSYRFTRTGDLDPAAASVGLYVYRHGQFTYDRSEPGQ
jgi:hypothetical protein